MSLISTGGGQFAWMKKEGGDHDFRHVLFYKAFVSQTRESGVCNLVILWKKNRQTDKIWIQDFSLCFNHEGLKTIKTGKMLGSKRKYYGDYARLSYFEAAALLQDAYCRHLLFGTCPDGKYTDISFLLECDTNIVDRMNLLRKTMNTVSSAKEFAGIYLSALRRLDNALLYDLSSRQRKAFLPSREEFIMYRDAVFDCCSFLQTRVDSCEIKGDSYALQAHAIISTNAGEVIRICFEMRISKENGFYYIDACEESERIILEDSHPDNPHNYLVYCSVYEPLKTDTLREWLGNRPGTFQVGESDGIVLYKWLKRQQETGGDFNVFDRIGCEFLLKEGELVLFAKNPLDLVNIEREVARLTNGRMYQKGKYHLPVSELYQMVVSLRTGGSFFEAANLAGYRASSALVFLHNSGRSFIPPTLETGAKLMPEGDCLYYHCENPARTACCGGAGPVEYYICGELVKINAYGGNVKQEVAVIDKQYKVGEAVYDYEWEGNSGQCQKVLSERRKWKILLILRLCHKRYGSLGVTGLIPTLKDTVKRLESLR